MKERLGSRIITLVLVSCALVSTGFVVRNSLRSPVATSRPASTLEPQTDWLQYAERGNRLGSESASVTIVEFGDFECPACATLASRFNDLLKRRPADVSVIYRHLPGSSHRFAVPAATASECAARFGKFEQMHDTLYSNQKSFGIRSWSELALSAGVTDTSGFADCLKDPVIAEAVAHDEAAGRKLKALGTPTILINGMRYTGVPPVHLLDSIVDAQIRENRSKRATPD